MKKEEMKTLFMLTVFRYAHLTASVDFVSELIRWNNYVTVKLYLCILSLYKVCLGLQYL